LVSTERRGCTEVMAYFIDQIESFPFPISLRRELSYRIPVDIRPKMVGFLGRMPSQPNPEDRIALLQGTLDLLILKTLVLGARHGQGIARSILHQSEEVFFVDHGSLYLALQRLEDKKWISAKWGVSENNRKARFYSLTSKGRQQLVEKTSEWQRLTRAMGLILDGGPSSEEV
jgi:PadR family transcriptional regulator PadR